VLTEHASGAVVLRHSAPLRDALAKAGAPRQGGVRLGRIVALCYLLILFIP
jgi:hypothetical protein